MLFKNYEIGKFEVIGGKNMKCPYCNSEMEKGYLQGNGSAIIWDKKKHRIRVHASKDGISLAFNFN